MCSKRLAIFALVLVGCGDSTQTPSPDAFVAPPPADAGIDARTDPCDVHLTPGADDQTTVQTALIDASEGSTICFDPGVYTFTDELSLLQKGVTLRGPADPGNHAILDFAGQVTGGNGLSVVGDDFTMQDLVIKDPPGDGVRVENSKGVTLRRLKVYWSKGASLGGGEGGYALYPVTSENVLVENCDVSGSADAAVYVGQSKNIIVRGNVAYASVAGIELENCTNGEVYDNITFNNTVGIAIFDLPGKPVQHGEGVSVHNNVMQLNNHPTFATPNGGVLAAVPPGSGAIIMATDDVEFHDNVLSGNGLTGVTIVSCPTFEQVGGDACDNPTSPNYDSFTEGTWVHDNTFMDNGTAPLGFYQIVVEALPLEDILWDGVVDPTKDDTDGSLALCITDNGDATFRNTDLAHFPSTNPTTDLAPFDCTHTPRPPVVF